MLRPVLSHFIMLRPVLSHLRYCYTRFKSLSVRLNPFCATFAMVTSVLSHRRYEYTCSKPLTYVWPILRHFRYGYTSFGRATSGLNHFCTRRSVLSLFQYGKNRVMRLSFGYFRFKPLPVWLGPF